MNPNERKATLTLCGFMASGKTTVGKLLASRLGYRFVDTDDMLFADTGMTLPQMFAIGGETYFRDLEHETVKKAAQLRESVISTGGGVMTFERNALILRENTEIIHIRRSFDVCYEAISRRPNRPIAGQKTREQMKEMYDSRIAAYEKYASLSVENNSSPEETVNAILCWLNS